MKLEIQVVVWDRQHKYAAGLNQSYIFYSLLYCSISNKSQVQTKLLSSVSIRFFIFHHFSQKLLKTFVWLCLWCFTCYFWDTRVLTCRHNSVGLPALSDINHIGGVMANMLTSSVVDHSQSPVRSNKTIQLVFAALSLCMQSSGVRAETGFLRIRFLCPGEATCLTCLLDDCCFIDLTLLRSN
jgi:hypothetical protein